MKTDYDNGIFWTTPEVFKQMFGMLAISKYKEDQKVNQHILEHGDGPRVFSFAIADNEEFYFNAESPNKRFFKGTTGCSQRGNGVSGFMARVSGGTDLSNYTYDTITVLD